MKKKKKGARSKHASSPPGKRAPLEKAVPPADNPLLRYEAERDARGEGVDDATMAAARAKAIEQTRAMPVADPDSDATGSV